ncbi:MAG: ParB/RepB/Spo0J family partition protein [Acidobacteriia bacterium]|nr:ParB/RepB/Spo0J family partition protein [Methyloceanibacter sp.]MCL6492986.1 ParB/RepB/Spo0J family partition protein [Terriglobia bacterium]
MSPKSPERRLGRGLAALFGEVDESTSDAAGSGVHLISVALLEPGPFQPRSETNDEALAELTDSIRAHGVLQPLLARPSRSSPDRYEIIAGERRWRAAQAAGLHEVPVFIRELTDVDAMAAALVENLQRQDLNPLEEAEGYRRLMVEHGFTQEALGAAVGKSRSHIANTLRLLQLPPSVKAEVRKGTLSAGHARALLAHPEPEKAALAVIARGLNVRQTEALVSRKAEPTATKSRSRPLDPETAALQHDLSERLGLKVEIFFDGQAGHIRIHYRNLAQLDGLIALLSREEKPSQ